MKEKFHLHLPCVKVIVIQFSIVQTSEMDAMIVSRTILENKTPKALKFLTNAKKTKNTPIVSKLSRTM
jgi:hypothetical protein